MFWVGGDAGSGVWLIIIYFYYFYPDYGLEFGFD